MFINQLDNFIKQLYRGFVKCYVTPNGDQSGGIKCGGSVLPEYQRNTLIFGKDDNMSILTNYILPTSL